VTIKISVRWRTYRNGWKIGARADFELRTWLRLTAHFLPGDSSLIVGPFTLSLQNWNGLGSRYD